MMPLPELPVNAARIEPDRAYHHQGLAVRFHLTWVADYDLPYETRTASDRDLRALASTGCGKPKTGTSGGRGSRATTRPGPAPPGSTPPNPTTGRTEMGYRVDWLNADNAYEMLFPWEHVSEHSPAYVATIPRYMAHRPPAEIKARYGLKHLRRVRVTEVSPRNRPIRWEYLDE